MIECFENKRSYCNCSVNSNLCNNCFSFKCKKRKHCTRGISVSSNCSNFECNKERNFIQNISNCSDYIAPSSRKLNDLSHNTTTFPNSISSNSLQRLYTWHQRLGHASSDALQHIKPLNLPTPLTSKDALKACEICHKGKQVRLPFPISTSNNEAAFELMHAYVWGPYSQPSMTGTNYMLTLVDDFSHATWVYLLQHKSQVTPTFGNFIRMVNTQFDTKLKKVRSDNGSEFVNKDFYTILNLHGIQHQRSTPYTPQQGKVERKHRHLHQLARSLMIQAGLPMKFWPYSLLMATHIVNRLPTATLVENSL